MTRLDFNPFTIPELEYKPRSLEKLLASGTLTDRSAFNQHHEITLSEPSWSGAAAGTSQPRRLNRPFPTNGHSAETGRCG